MRIHLLTINHRVPEWVTAAYGEYAKRLPPGIQLVLTEIGAARRGPSDTTARRREGDRVLKSIPGGAWVVALAEQGEPWSTVQLAERLAGWMHSGRPVALLVGGADGLDGRCLEAADQRWSLSPLTLPHAVIRVIVAEQIYRAWSLLSHHPYHRA